MSDMVEINAVPFQETEKAWLVDFEGLKDVWVPKRISEWDARTSTFLVAAWFAEKEGLV